MEMEKIINLNDAELVHQERQAAEQIFRLRFQMRMGQNDGVQKLRGLKKDIARIKTVVRQRQLGIVTTHASSASHETATVEKVAKVKTVKTAAPKAAKVAGKSKTANKSKVASKSAHTATAKPKKVATKSKAASSKAAGGKVQSNAMKGSR